MQLVLGFSRQRQTFPTFMRTVVLFRASRESLGTQYQCEVAAWETCTMLFQCVPMRNTRELLTLLVLETCNGCQDG